jgi:hypothetical protein
LRRGEKRRERKKGMLKFFTQKEGEGEGEEKEEEEQARLL